MPDPAFKPYRQNQMRLLPLDLSDMVPANHMARVGALMDEIDDLNDEEGKLFGDMPEPGEATADDVEEVARRISERLKEAPKDKALKKAKRLVEDDYLPRMRRYERDLADMGGRKSLSKTDRDELRKRAAGRLTSDEGVVLRRRRSTDVETMFGDVRRNWGFRRFTLRGIEKAAHEWRLLMMGHNIRKLAWKSAGAAANPVPATA